MTLTDVFPEDWIRSPEGVLWQVAWLDLPYIVCRPPTTGGLIDAHKPIASVKIHADQLTAFKLVYRSLEFGSRHKRR